MAQTVSKARQQAKDFIEAAKAGGFLITGIDNEVVTIEKFFEAGDRDAYVQADGSAYSVLRHAPMLYPGTTWGTDSASVGGHAGMTGGYYRMSKSGVSRRFITALRKELAR